MFENHVALNCLAQLHHFYVVAIFILQLFVLSVQNELIDDGWSLLCAGMLEIIYVSKLDTKISSIRMISR